MTMIFPFSNSIVMLGIPGTCSLDDEYVLKQALLESGFKDVATESVNVNFAFSSAQDYTRFHQAVTAPVHAMLANETQREKKRSGIPLLLRYQQDTLRIGQVL